MRIGECVEMVDAPAAYLDLVDCMVVGDDIRAVEWSQRTALGHYGNHAIAHTARVHLRVGGAAKEIEVQSPEGVHRLRQYLALRPAFVVRAA